MSHDQLRSADNGQVTPAAMPDPEVVVKPKHRQFTAEYKRRILAEADASSGTGQLGALLRREGLYSSHLSDWRRQREQGAMQGLTPKPRGPKLDPLAAENARLQREVERLQAQLQRAETIIDVQKKISQLLGLPTAASETNGSKGSTP